MSHVTFKGVKPYMLMYGSSLIETGDLIAVSAFIRCTKFSWSFLFFCSVQCSLSPVVYAAVLIILVCE